MKIGLLKEKDISKLSGFICEIIKTTPYYSKWAKFEEIKKHNPESIKRYFADKKYYAIFVAEEKNKIIGFVVGRNESGVLWIDWLGVEKNMRRKGIAEKLIVELETRLAKKGIHKIWCDTRTDNKESNTLFSKLGYKKLGKFINGWYKQDFFLWEKDLK